MSKRKVTFNFDSKAIIAKIDAAASAALPIVAQQALADCGEYVPRDQGTLKESGIIHSDVMNNKIAWQTPYSRCMYYGISPSGKAYNYSKQPNPKACKLWCEKAEAECGGSWDKIFNKKINEELKK